VCPSKTAQCLQRTEMPCRLCLDRLRRLGCVLSLMRERFPDQI
jgi:hypothetical protein